MATRLVVQANREALYEFLKKSCLDGTLPPGSMLPAVRELSEQHGVTVHAVFQVIQRLSDEGVVYTIPRVGAFVGHPVRESVEPYLMVVPPHEGNVEHYLVQAQFGFEDRIAQLGGHSIIATPVETRLHLKRNDLPELSGIFESLDTSITGERLFAGEKAPVAIFGRLVDTDGTADCVSFDDEGGGSQAARHLWQNGHRSIAFLGLHSEQDESNRLIWSRNRELGWQRAMAQFRCEVEGLAFRPRETSAVSSKDQMACGYEAAQGLIGRSDVSAVIVVNALAAEGMFEAFRVAQWPAAEWPSIVCFDYMPGTGGSVVSYLRLPWENIGCAVAEMLWERRTGRLVGEPVQRLVPMRLIPRLSCRIDWTISSGLAQSHCFGAPLQELVPAGK